MTHQPHNNKGWLRQYMSNPSIEQIERFNHLVESALKHFKNPDQVITEAIRRVAYEIMGGVME